MSEEISLPSTMRNHEDNITFLLSSFSVHAFLSGMVVPSANRCIVSDWLYAVSDIMLETERNHSESLFKVISSSRLQSDSVFKAMHTCVSIYHTSSYVRIRRYLIGYDIPPFHAIPPIPPLLGPDERASPLTLHPRTRLFALTRTSPASLNSAAASRTRADLSEDIGSCQR